MDNKDKIQLFENTPVRHEWDADRGEWLFSVVDVVAVLTEQPEHDAARKYWKVLKGRLKKEGSELVTNCYQLKLKSSKDGKKGIEYAILTDEITKAWSGMTTKEYKSHKGLKKENLRDNMTDLELVLTMLSEATTTELAKVENPQGFLENQKIAHRGGKIAGDARAEIEAETGRKVISSSSAPELEP